MRILLLSITALMGIMVNADPTRPETDRLGLSSSSVLETSLRLQGIIVNQQSRLAIISRQLLSVGDEVNGHRVVSITPSRVVLVNMQTAEERTLSIRPDGIDVKPR